MLAGQRVPLAFRVCEHWFGRHLQRRSVLRELLPARRGPARAAWAAGCRRTAAGAATAARARRRAQRSRGTRRRSGGWSRAPFVEPVLERVGAGSALRRPLRGGRARAGGGAARSCSSAASRRTRGSPSRSKRSRCCAPSTACWRAWSSWPEDGAHGARDARPRRRLGVAAAVSGAAKLPRAGRRSSPRARADRSSVWDEPFPLVTIEGALARVPARRLRRRRHRRGDARRDTRCCSPAATRRRGGGARPDAPREPSRPPRASNAQRRAQHFDSGPTSGPGTLRARCPCRAHRNSAKGRPGQPQLSPAP